MTLLTAPQTLPFGTAACVMIGLAVIEAIAMCFAMSASQLLDGLIPDQPDGIDGALGWLHVGKVPLLALLILFLTGFSLSGYAMQAISKGMIGNYLPTWLASLAAAVVAVSAVRSLGGLLGKAIPRDETSAVSQTTLIGRAGVIITGTAKAGFAAEARVRDQHGNSHYLMVEPDVADEELEQGTEVLIVNKQGARYRAIRHPHPTVY